jgi:hypothetical protein
VNLKDLEGSSNGLMKVLLSHHLPGETGKSQKACQSSQFLDRLKMSTLEMKVKCHHYTERLTGSVL